MRSQVSRLFVKRYLRPRDDSGRFLPGWIFWTRAWHHAKDGRWIHYPKPDEYSGWPGP